MQYGEQVPRQCTDDEGRRIDQRPQPMRVPENITGRHLADPTVEVLDLNPGLSRQIKRGHNQWK
jgi:hypothetical protein